MGFVYVNMDFFLIRLYTNGDFFLLFIVIKNLVIKILLLFFLRFSLLAFGPGLIHCFLCRSALLVVSRTKRKIFRKQ